MAAGRRRRVPARGEPALIAALPAAGVLVPGRSLAGVRLGEPAAAVRRQLGTDFGLCHGCATPTWYFTYRRFDDKGLAVELTGGRVSAVYTLMQPAGWHDTRGRTLGAPQSALPDAIPIACSGYQAFESGPSVYYVVSGTLWGFGLIPRGRSPCR